MIHARQMLPRPRHLSGTLRMLQESLRHSQISLVDIHPCQGQARFQPMIQIVVRYHKVVCVTIFAYRLIPLSLFLEQASYMVMAKRNADNRPGRTIMLHRIIVINKSGIHHATHLEDRAKVRIVHGQAEITIQGTFLFQRYSENTVGHLAIFQC